jgi:hypothetical protein
MPLAPSLALLLTVARAGHRSSAVQPLTLESRFCLVWAIAGKGQDRKPSPLLGKGRLASRESVDVDSSAAGSIPAG